MASGVVVGAAVHAHDRAMIGPLAILLIMSVERNQSSLQVECSAPVLCRGFRSPRGFGLKPSTTRPGGWQRAWALAAAWREQLGEGDAGAGRGGVGEQVG